MKKCAIGKIVEYYPMPENQEYGYSIEGLIYQNTVEVSESQIKLISINKKQDLIYIRQ